MAFGENAQIEPQAGSPSGLELIIRCYEAVIQDLLRAKEYHEAQNAEDTYDRIRHAQDIITELLLGLDYERGGDIAQNLARIYNFALRQLIGINNQQDTKMYDHLILIFADLKDAWEQIRLTSSV